MQNCFVNSVTNQVTDADVLVCILRVHRFAILLSLLKFYFLKPNMYKSFLIISQSFTNLPRLDQSAVFRCLQVKPAGETSPIMYPNIVDKLFIIQGFKLPMPCIFLCFS